VGSPFDIPFVVENKSALFSLRELSIQCVLLNAATTLNNRFVDVAISGVGTTNEIGPMQSRPYTCPFNRLIQLPPADTIATAQIQFESQHESRLPFRSTAATATSDVFTWSAQTSPPHWVVGIPLE
jgi:hypothetical protein